MTPARLNWGCCGNSAFPQPGKPLSITGAWVGLGRIAPAVQLRRQTGACVSAHQAPVAMTSTQTSGWRMDAKGIAFGAPNCRRVRRVRLARLVRLMRLMRLAPMHRDRISRP